MRPLRPDDAQRHLGFIRALSPISSYRRLMYAVSSRPPELVAALLDVDGERRVAYVAVTEASLASEAIIGVSRNAATAAPAECDFAVVVADAWQGRSVGGELLRTLLSHARELDYRRVVGTVLTENAAMRRLAPDAGFHLAAAGSSSPLLELHLRLP